MNKLYKPKSLSILAFCLAMLFNSCQSPHTPKSGSPAGKKLSFAQCLRVKRFLHPMPQELRLSDSASEIKLERCALKYSSKASSEEKLAIDNFRKRWLKKQNSTLKNGTGTLTIIAGTLKNSPELRQAAEKGVFNAKYLSERPNPEQAYTIVTTCENSEIKVYVAANAAPGLNYGLLTLEQLFNSLSRAQNLVLPHCEIVDWPDLKERGILSFYAAATKERLERYSGLKLNIFYFKIYIKVSPDKKISFSKNYRKTYLAAKKDFIAAIPALSHLDCQFMPKLNAMVNFPELAAKAKELKDKVAGSAHFPFCYSKPKTQVIMDQIFEGIANANMGDRVQIWLGETPNCCHCELCKGDVRGHFIREVKNVIHGYQKALKINPELKMDILLTQGTYKHNYALLDHIPKGVGIDIYSGSGDNNTYKSRHGEYVLTPQAEAIVAQGFDTGAVPSIGASVNHEYLFPSFMSQFVKLRMNETKDRGLNRVDCWMAHWRLQNLNLDALAEFSWNTDGRTSKECVAAWATRQGMKNPDQVAEIIELLEYPIRALASGTRTRGVMYRAISRAVARLNGKKPYWSEWFEVLKGFEYANHEELARALKECEKAVKLSKKQGNQELIAASVLTKQWIAIFERYAFFLECKDSNEKNKAKNDVKKLATDLPKLWKNWINLKTQDQNTLKKVRPSFNKTMKEFEKLK